MSAPVSASVGALEGGALRGRRVLLVDDEPLILLDLEMEFEEAGMVPVLGRDVATSLALLDGTSVAAAVLDVNLGPGETCMPIAERLRERGVPFVLHSGEVVRHGDVVAALDAPLVGKPAPAGSLVEALARQMAG